MKSRVNCLEKLGPILEKIRAMTTEVGKTGAIQKLEEIEHYVNPLRSFGGKTITVILGEFKRGKSSFINALLEEEICPIDTDITTSIVSQIQYGTEDKAIVYFSENTTTPITKEQIHQYVTEQGNRNNEKQVQVVDVWTTNPRLEKSNMIIVDTPGLGALNKSHTEITLKYLTKSDIVLFISDATSPLTTSELEIIEKAYRMSKHMYFILTKIDLVRGWKDVLQENQTKINQMLPDLGRATTFIPVSSCYKWDYVESEDMDSLSFSNFKTLEHWLFEELQENIIRQKLLAPLIEIRKILQDYYQRPLYQEKKALSEQNPRDSMQKQIQEEKERKAKLLRSAWPNKLADAHTDLRLTINEVVEERFKQLNRTIEMRMKDKNFYRDINGINQYIKNELFIISTEMDRLLNEFTDHMFEYVNTELSLKVGEQESRMLSERLELDDMTIGKFEQKSAIDKTMSYVRHFSGIITFSSLGTISGSLISTVLGVSTGGIGMAALAIGGTIVFLSKDKVKTTELLSECKEIIREAQRSIQTQLQRSLYDVQKEIKRAIEHTVKVNVEECDNRIKEWEKTLQSSVMEMAKRKADIEKTLQNVTEIERQLIAIQKEVQVQA